MKVTFILHSCYHVELENCCLLFDWYEGDIPPSDKPLYVFASHCHGDHFSPKVFETARPGRRVRFILSDDIWESRVPEGQRENTLFVAPRRAYEVDGLKIATLQSTDQGVAFLVECEGRLLYHAGDLNCWVWDGAPPYQNDQMREIYRQELEPLAGRPIDTAFVPLDPRQEADFDLGMRYFFETAQAKRVFPIHMWGDYSVVPLFKADPHYQAYAPLLMDVSAPGQVFDCE
ncbi:MBL fold metallo-hydrolase [Acutalibacter caecimuris]|uniref:MBL fold metallo-hydrolase n=1 Tax=Acutalibacter caecimuris TaxID=3093657 RepID=UPI002AC94DA8|nr:MBL fold metallo-hydrolase [Acutalibacter sp. M00118]